MCISKIISGDVNWIELHLNHVQLPSSHGSWILNETVCHQILN